MYVHTVPGLALFSLQKTPSAGEGAEIEKHRQIEEGGSFPISPSVATMKWAKTRISSTSR